MIYHMKTKLPITYESNHWFHIAEKFMAPHTLMREQKSQTDSSEIFLYFDKSGFIKDLNGMTKFMVILGVMKEPTKQHQYNPSIVHYIDSNINDNKIPKEVKRGDSFLFDPKSNEFETEFLDKTISTNNRFITSTQHISHHIRGFSNTSSTGKRVCVRLMANVGGEEHPLQRGHWFPNQGDVEDFRAKMAVLCPFNRSAAPPKQKRFKLVLYQRDLSRTLKNQEGALSWLRRGLSADWELQVVMHKADPSPCELSHKLYDADVLLTPHGFQSMLLLFLPRPALMFEVFPYRYYKRAYGPLSVEYGILHGGTMSPPLEWLQGVLLSLVSSEACMLNRYCRSYARAFDVKLTRGGADKLLLLIGELEQRLGDQRQQHLLYPRHSHPASE